MWITWLFGNYFLDLLDCLLSSWNKWNFNVCSEKCLAYVLLSEIIKLHYQNLPNVKGIIFHVFESFVIKPTLYLRSFLFFRGSLAGSSFSVFFVVWFVAMRGAYRSFEKGPHWLLNSIMEIVRGWQAPIQVYRNEQRKSYPGWLPGWVFDKG